MAGDGVCFVVMPFGRKPLPAGGSSAWYDFDKVYRVIIQRAVTQAGLIPIRADERVGSALIHTDMFRDLRDQPVVLADLSLENPNVFYELGIRHVMSPTGTVLMCRKGSALPFDVRLSRVIFYDFDGVNLDWDEVERVVLSLQPALQEARSGRPDSPVHALLEPVIRVREIRGARLRARTPDQGRFSKYERLLAQRWIEGGKSLDEIFNYTEDVFGCRALGYYCLAQVSLPERSEEVAHRLENMEQFALSIMLFERLRESGTLSDFGLQIYATAYSEANPDIAGADMAIGMSQEAVRQLDRKYADSETPERLTAMADSRRRVAGLQHWRWQLSKSREDLATAIEGLGEAVRAMDDAKARGAWKAPGLIAQGRLKHLLMLRMREENPERPDAERNVDEILALEQLPDDDPDSVSWLHWFKAIVLADSGAAAAAHLLALQTVVADAVLKQKPEYWQIGRWQYRNLRRFIEQNSDGLRNPSSVGLISQVLQAGEEAV